MCGGNYYNSVIQFLQAEKTIRIRSLVFMRYNMKEIRQVLSQKKSVISNSKRKSTVLSQNWKVLNYRRHCFKRCRKINPLLHRWLHNKMHSENALRGL